MKRAQRQEFDENAEQPEQEQPARPRTWECSANGCPHVGAIRMPGHAQLVCGAHAMAEPRLWQRVTDVLREHRELLAACRLACSQPMGYRRADTDAARALLDTALSMPTGLADFLEPSLSDRVQRAGVRSKIIAMRVERAIVELSLVGAKRKAGEKAQRDPDSAVDQHERRFGDLLARAGAKVDQLRDLAGRA